MKRSILSIFKKTQSGLFPLLITLACILLPTLSFGGLYNTKAPPDKQEAAKAFKAEDDKAVIYVYRKSSFVAFIQAFRIYLNDQSVVDCTSGTFIRLVVDPGTHRIGVGSVSSRTLRDSLVIPTEEGKLYYVELEIGANIFSGVPKLKSTDLQTAQKEIKNCSLILLSREEKVKN